MNTQAIPIEIILTNLLKESFSRTNKPLLLACSGGLDSVVLFHLLVKENISFAVAHANFQLREKESDEDEEFVRSLCNTYTIPVHLKRFNTHIFVEKSGESIQMVARKLRYEWFSEILKSEGYAAVVTAHHADDNVETVLLNMTRGCGVSGLAGMDVFDGTIFRPLLNISRKQLFDYATTHQINWREDYSNQKSIYKRNAIRLNIIPEFEQLNPAFKETFYRNIQHWQQENILLNSFLKKLIKKLTHVRGKAEVMNVKTLLSLPSPESVLHHWLKAFHFNYNTVSDIIQVIRITHESRIFYSDTHRLVYSKNDLALQQLNEIEVFTHLIEKPNLTVETDSQRIKFEVIPYHKDIRVTNNHYHFLSADKIRFPILIRPFRPGDYFYPFGLNKKKKISDFFTEKKLSVIEKESAMILCVGDKIICIVGMEIDHRFRVTDTTKNVLRIRITKLNN